MPKKISSEPEACAKCLKKYESEDPLTKQKKSNEKTCFECQETLKFLEVEEDAQNELEIQTTNMSKIRQVKNQQELKKALQILGQGIGPVHINEKGEIIIFDEKIKKEFNLTGWRIELAIMEITQTIQLTPPVKFSRHGKHKNPHYHREYYQTKRGYHVYILSDELLTNEMLCHVDSFESPDKKLVEKDIKESKIGEKTCQFLTRQQLSPQFKFSTQIKVLSTHEKFVNRLGEVMRKIRGISMLSLIEYIKYRKRYTYGGSGKIIYMKTEKQKFKEFLKKAEDPNYQREINKSLPENPSSLQVAKFKLCKKILGYKLDNNLTREQIADKIQLSKAETEDILFCEIEKFTLDRLTEYASNYYQTKPGREMITSELVLELLTKLNKEILEPMEYDGDREPYE
ncbi:1345_t:CDS:10 [Entrophospora sp. SA101]|nr:1345_t:CDS:10 [Entrophospora sp. SA101]